MNGAHRIRQGLYSTLCAALVTGIICAATSLSAEPKKAPAIEISADKLEVTQTKRRAVFSGNVRIKRGAMSLTCTSLEATYDDQGALTTLKAMGAVTVKGANITASAGLARFSQEQGTLILTDNPTLKRGRSRMRGTQIKIWIDEERVVIEQAKGTLDPTLLTAPDAKP